MSVTQCPTGSTCTTIAITNNSVNPYNLKRQSGNCTDTRTISLPSNSTINARLVSNCQYQMGGYNSMIPSGIEHWQNDGIDGFSSSSFENFISSASHAYESFTTSTAMNFTIDPTGKLLKQTSSGNPNPKIIYDLNSLSAFQITN
jgi:hypothetical protein